MGGTVSMLRAMVDQSMFIPKPPLTEKTLPDQTGKVFFITGANSGVGYEVSRILYSQNGTVYLGCRTESKAQEAISAIKTAYPQSKGKLVYIHLDLGDLTTIKSTAEEFLAKESRLDWLDNNAGVMVPPRGSKTTQDHELQHGTNVLGPYLLTKLLLPVLQTTAASQPRSERGTVRVSWAGSFAVDGFSPKGGMKFDQEGNVDECKDSPDTAYGATKAANWWLAYEFGRRYGDRDGVLHNSYNPGNLHTNLAQHVPQFVQTLMQWTLLYPAVYGAYTEIFAGLSRDLTIEKDQGGFVIPWGRRSTWNRADVVKGMKGEGSNSEKLVAWCERETSQYA